MNLKQMLVTLFFSLTSATPIIAQESNLIELDKCFKDNSGANVCIAIPTKADTIFEVNHSHKTIKAKSKLTFKINPQSDKTSFFMQQFVNTSTLNNQKIAIERKKAPGNEDWLIIIPNQADKKESVIELEYEVKNLTMGGLNWSGFWWRSDFSDSTDARFINAFTPASFEAVRYPMNYSFKFIGLNKAYKSLNLYTNAEKVEKLGRYNYQLKFSSMSNLSSPYFEFTTMPHNSHTFSYQGKYQPIPVTVYFPQKLENSKKLSLKTLIAKTENSITKTLEKFEHTMGQYPFDKLLVKVYSLYEGDLPLSLEYSMEYGGAVVSRLELVPHELCHQWFARGASPKDGQSGFVDEVICDWYDYDNPVITPNPQRKPTLLSSPNAWTLRTPESSYQEGTFMGEIAYFYQQKGLSIYPVLRDFYQKFRLSSYRYEDFVNILESSYPGDLKPHFKKYIHSTVP